MKEDRFFVNHLTIRFSQKGSKVIDDRAVVRYGYESHNALYDVDVIPTQNGHEVRYSKNCVRCEPTRIHRSIQKRYDINTRPVEGFLHAEELVT